MAKELEARAPTLNQLKKLARPPIQLAPTSHFRQQDYQGLIIKIAAIKDKANKNLNPNFPIERTLRSFGSCRIKGTDESLSRVHSSVPLMRHGPNDLRVRSIGKSGFRF